ARLDAAHQELDEVDEQVAAGPEAQELARLRARHQAAVDGQAEADKKIAAQEAEATAAVVDDKDPAPMFKRIGELTAARQKHALVAQAIAPAVEAAQARYTQAHQAAVADALATMRSDAEGCEKAALGELHRSVLKLAAEVDAERFLMTNLYADHFV